MLSFASDHAFAVLVGDSAHAYEYKMRKNIYIYIWLYGIYLNKNRGETRKGSLAPLEYEWLRMP